jgi:hypothetical protein
VRLRSASAARAMVIPVSLLFGCGGSNAPEPNDLPAALADATTRLEGAGCEVHAVDAGAGQVELRALVATLDHPAVVAMVPEGHTNLDSIPLQIHDPDGSAVETASRAYCSTFLAAASDAQTARRALAASGLCRQRSGG